MNSNNVMRNYKHDITGKFKDITTAVSALDEVSFADTQNHEVFHAIHEVLVKMVKTSRNTMMNHMNQEAQLHVVNDLPGTDLPKIKIEGVVVRYQLTEKKLDYYLSLTENEGNPIFLLGKLHGFLPLTENEMKRVIGTLV